MKGTAMSIAGFNMFLGGALGTYVNGILIRSYGTQSIFFNSAVLILAVGLLAALLVARFEMRKRMRMTGDASQQRAIA
jgi:MFS family permease